MIRVRIVNIRNKYLHANKKRETHTQINQSSVL